jgi:GNAT superfamily N-acetyltransferase
MIIRRLSAADGGAFFELRRAAILAGCAGSYPAKDLERWTAPSAEDQLDVPVPEHFYGGWQERTLIASGMLGASTGRIDAVFVGPSLQGRGIGTAIMNHLQAIAQDLGVPALRLDATLNAVPFYRSLGFVEAGRAQFRSPRGVILDCVSMLKNMQPVARGLAATGG